MPHVPGDRRILVINQSRQWQRDFFLDNSKWTKRYKTDSGIIHPKALMDNNGGFKDKH
jgi:hypothetical protein